jgi:SAM-dependent methyltransferase
VIVGDKVESLESLQSLENSENSARTETLESLLEDVKEYYGKTLGSSQDLQTSACCCAADSVPREIRETLPLIADEILDKFYGCGSPLPPLLEGLTVLDLGCGTGRDVYLVSKLVGEKGHVIGVDMTDEQIAVARKYQNDQARRFGYTRSNVEFKQGYIEDLAALGIADDSVDVVISNCVINLSPAKELVFKEIRRVLKAGGELYFSDVFADRRMPSELASDPVLKGECLAGALYTEDFRRLMARAGWLDFRYSANRAMTLDNPAFEAKIGMVNFSSRTVRAFKLDTLEDLCEDYGQVAIYRGSIPAHPHAFDLDDHHHFITGKPMLVCGNTAALVSETRFTPHFQLIGDRSVHYGAFDCSGCGSTAATTAAVATDAARGSSSGCC